LWLNHPAGLDGNTGSLLASCHLSAHPVAQPAGFAFSALLRGRNARKTPSKGNEAYEERLATLEEMGIEEKALIYDEATDKISISTTTQP